MARKTHIPIPSTKRTYCGLDYQAGGRLIAVIDLKRDVVDSATCRNCQKSDDRRVLEDHWRECREAGIDPETMEPIKS